MGKRQYSLTRDDYKTNDIPIHPTGATWTCDSVNVSVLACDTMMLILAFFYPWRVNDAACVLETFPTLCLCSPVELFSFFLIIFSCSVCPFFTSSFFRPVSAISRPDLSFSISPPWLQMSLFPPQEIRHPPTVLSDWTREPLNFCVMIKFFLTWARGVLPTITSLYRGNKTTRSWRKRDWMVNVIILMPPSIEKKVSNRIRVMEWKADWDFSKLIRPRERAGLRRCAGLQSFMRDRWMGGKQRLRTGSVYERERMKEEKDQQRSVCV